MPVDGRFELLCGKEIDIERAFEHIRFLEPMPDGEMHPADLPTQSEDGRLRLLTQVEELDRVADEPTKHAPPDIDDLPGHDPLEAHLPRRGETRSDLCEECAACCRVDHGPSPRSLHLDGLADELPGEVAGLGPGLACEHGSGS